jgi:type IV pilus assembly protein PilW
VRTPAVRLVVVARSDKYESKIDSATKQRVCDTVTTAAPTWDGSAGAPILLTGNSSWQCYRYQTFENIAPTRNVISMGTQAGC